MSDTHVTDTPVWRLQVHPELGSTSDVCAALAARGEPAGLAVLALRQTQARGSRGRFWQSPSGNLSLSILLRPRGPLAANTAWPLLAGVAVADAARRLLPEPDTLSLKWPNDVLLRGRKLGGVLIDTAVDPTGGLRWLVIGIGVNLAVAPDLPDRRTACLAEEGIAPPSPEAFARGLLGQLALWQSALQRDGFAAIRAAWLARAHPVGTHLAIVQGDVRHEGAFAGLSGEGHLLLDSAEGRRTISSGEVMMFSSS